jgi:hypothetical protein
VRLFTTEHHRIPQNTTELHRIPQNTIELAQNIKPKLFKIFCSQTIFPDLIKMVHGLPLFQNIPPTSFEDSINKIL